MSGYTATMLISKLPFIRDRMSEIEAAAFALLSELGPLTGL